jgi:DNA-binding XRE family transcriptional regulator
MTEQIPDRIKRLIWIRHIKGESPTRICKKLGISRTSYYSIIRDTESQDPDISLMRTLAVNLRKNGLDTRKYAKSLRISNL